MKKRFKFLSFILVVSLCSFYLGILGFSKNNFIDSPASELLGISSNYNLFVENTATLKGSDCEGRLAAGHGANLNNYYYSVGSAAQGSAAKIVVGDGILDNFTGGSRVNAVIGPDCKVGNNLAIGTIDIAKPIDFSEEFQHLRNLSIQLLKKENSSEEIVETWCKQIYFKGTNPNYNIFTINSNLIDTDKMFFNFDVPKDSYCIVNVLGDNLDFYTQLYGVSYAGQRINSNSDNLISKILYNFPQAKSLNLKGIGTLYGTVLAPNADVKDNIFSGTHCGGLIAKSFAGGIEFGNICFTGPNIHFEELVETTTPTATTITTKLSTIAATTTPLNTTFTTTTSTTTSTTILTTTTTKKTTITTTFLNTITNKQTITSIRTSTLKINSTKNTFSTTVKLTTVKLTTTTAKLTTVSTTKLTVISTTKSITILTIKLTTTNTPILSTETITISTVKLTSMTTGLTTTTELSTSITTVSMMKLTTTITMRTIATTVMRTTNPIITKATDITTNTTITISSANFEILTTESSIILTTFNTTISTSLLSVNPVFTTSTFETTVSTNSTVENSSITTFKKKDSPKTGDNFPLIEIIGIGFLSLGISFKIKK